MNHLFSFRTWSGHGLVRVEGWRGLVAHEGLKGSFFLFPFFFIFTGGHLDVRSAPYSRRILKHYSPRKLHMSIHPSSVSLHSTTDIILVLSGILLLILQTWPQYELLI